MAALPPRFRLLIAAVSVLCALASVATAASAHADLESSDPLSGSALSSFPPSLTLEFSEPVAPQSVAVSLEDETGASIPTGPPALTRDDRRVTVDVPRAEQQAGTYQVRWSVRSAIDGHDSSGLIVFTVGTGRAPVDASLELDERDAWWMIATRATWLLALSLIAARIVGRFGFGSVIPFRLVAAAGAVTLTCSLALVRPWSNLDWQSDATRLTVASGLTALVVAALTLYQSRHGAAVALAGWFGAIALAAAAGHARGSSQPELAIALDSAHTALALLWIAGLISLLAGVRRSQSKESLAAFSSLATAGLIVLVAAGLGMAVLHIPDARTLTTGGYGTVLLVKSAVVLLVVAIAAANRWITMPTLAAEAPGTPVDRQAFALLASEVVVLAIVVAAATVLSATSPPADQATIQVASPVRTIADSTSGGDAQVSLRGTIAGTVDDTVGISVSGPGEIQRVIVATRYLDPAAGTLIDGERFDASPVPGAPGEYVFSALRLSRQARWTVDITVRRSGRLDETVSFAVDTTAWSAEPPRRVERSWTWPIIPAGALGLIALAIVVPLGGMALIRRHGPISPLSGAVLIVALAMIAAGFTVQAWQRSAIRTNGHELEPPGATDPVAGRSTWDLLCLACHAADGSGLDQASPGHSHGGGTNLIDTRTRTLSDGDLYWLITHGVPGSDMPAYEIPLTDQQRWDLVAYLRDLQSAGPAAKPDP